MIVKLLLQNGKKIIYEKWIAEEDMALGCIFVKLNMA